MRSIAAVLVFGASLSAEIISISPKYAKEQKFTLELKKSREDSRANSPSGSTTTPVAVSVIETGADGSVVRWTMGAVTYADPVQAANPLVQQLTKAVAGLAFDIKLAGDGAFAGLRNEAEIGSRLSNFVDLIMKDLSAALPEGQTATVERIVRQLLSPQILTASATKEIQLYFGLAGVELETDKPIRVPMKTPNPVGGDAFESEIELRVVKHDQAAGSVEIQMDQDFDPKIFASMIRTLTAMPGVPPVEGELPSGKMYDRATYVVDLRSGWVRQVKHVRTVEAGDFRRVDTTEIRLVD